MTSPMDSMSKIWRELWEQHVIWTRSFIISTAAALGDLEWVTQRLLRNPVDMADALRPIFGYKIASQFQKLFTDHLTIGASLVNAAKAGDKAEVSSYERQWYANADQIAAFLAQLSPYWSREQWQTYLYDHLRMTKDEAVLRLQGRYAEDIKLFDAIQAEALAMADYMTQGIERDGMKQSVRYRG